jgi:hypothetical protein
LARLPTTPYRQFEGQTYFYGRDRVHTGPWADRLGDLAVHQAGERARLQGEVGELSERLEARKTVERAKGLLTEQGLSEPEAYRLMQRAAMDRGKKLEEIAKLVIEGRFDPPG